MAETVRALAAFVVFLAVLVVKKKKNSPRLERRQFCGRKGLAGEQGSRLATPALGDSNGTRDYLDM
jgi:hypothetical protein